MKSILNLIFEIDKKDIIQYARIENWSEQVFNKVVCDCRRRLLLSSEFFLCEHYALHTLSLKSQIML